MHDSQITLHISIFEPNDSRGKCKLKPVDVIQSKLIWLTEFQAL